MDKPPDKTKTRVCACRKDKNGDTQRNQDHNYDRHQQQQQQQDQEQQKSTRRRCKCPLKAAGTSVGTAIGNDRSSSRSPTKTNSGGTKTTRTSIQTGGEDGSEHTVVQTNSPHPFYDVAEFDRASVRSNDGPTELYLQDPSTRTSGDGIGSTGSPPKSKKPSPPRIIPSATKCDCRTRRMFEHLKSDLDSGLNSLTRASPTDGVRPQKCPKECKNYSKQMPQRGDSFLKGTGTNTSPGITRGDLRIDPRVDPRDGATTTATDTTNPNQSKEKFCKWNAQHPHDPRLTVCRCKKLPPAAPSTPGKTIHRASGSFDDGRPRYHQEEYDPEIGGNFCRGRPPKCEEREGYRRDPRDGASVPSSVPSAPGTGNVCPGRPPKCEEREGYRRDPRDGASLPSSGPSAPQTGNVCPGRPPKCEGREGYRRDPRDGASVPSSAPSAPQTGTGSRTRSGTTGTTGTGTETGRSYPSTRTTDGTSMPPSGKSGHTYQSDRTDQTGETGPSSQTGQSYPSKGDPSVYSSTKDRSDGIPSFRHDPRSLSCKGVTCPKNLGQTSQVCVKIPPSVTCSGRPLRRASSRSVDRNDKDPGHPGRDDPRSHSMDRSSSRLQIHPTRRLSPSVSSHSSYTGYQPAPPREKQSKTSSGDSSPSKDLKPKSGSKGSFTASFHTPHGSGIIGDQVDKTRVKRDLPDGGTLVVCEGGKPKICKVGTCPAIPTCQGVGGTAATCVGRDRTPCEKQLSCLGKLAKVLPMVAGNLLGQDDGLISGKDSKDTKGSKGTKGSLGTKDSLGLKSSLGPKGSLGTKGFVSAKDSKATAGSKDTRDIIGSKASRDTKGTKGSKGSRGARAAYDSHHGSIQDGGKGVKQHASVDSGRPVWNKLMDFVCNPYFGKIFKALLLFLLGLKICSESWYMLIPIRGFATLRCPCNCIICKHL